MPQQSVPKEFERYSRQMLFRDMGHDGQRHLAAARVLVAGCGALGSALAETLVRAGCGHVRIVDRDFVELSNLQRQVLFDEEDVAQALPKAVAAGRKLARVNSDVTVEPIVADIDASNILKLAGGMQVIVDGMDNFETRFLINDAALELGIPWIYGGCVGSHGQVMSIIPGRTACLRCLLGDVPPAGAAETCDTAGVLGPAVNVVAAFQSVAALKMLAGRGDLVEPVLLVIDVWDGTVRKMNVANLRDQANCPACLQGARDWLYGSRGSQSTVLCGRNAVQVSPAQRCELALEELAARLQPAGAVTRNAFLLRLALASGHELTVFPDGRAIIKGTDDPAVARGLYARYVGL